MADEEKKTLTDQQTGEKIEATPGYTKGEAERMPEAETPIEKAVTEGLELSEKAEDTPVVEAFDKALTSVQEAVETLEPQRDEGITDFRRPMIEAAGTFAGHTASAPADHAHVDFLSDTTTIMGRTITVQGGIYTVVFGVLAVATLAEVLIGSLPFGVLLIPLLLGIATVKAGLVVAYYMHLRVDPRIFMYILIIPLVLVTLATLYLLSVPPTGY